MLGLKHMMSVPHFSQKSLRHHCKLYVRQFSFIMFPLTCYKVDGEEIAIPLGLHCLVALNIPSYCGGANPWACSSNVLEGSLPQSICDGVIEIFGMKGTRT